MGAIGRKRIEDRLNWESESIKLVRLCRNLLSKPNQAEEKQDSRVVYPRLPSQQVSQIE